MQPELSRRLSSATFRGALWITLIALLTTGAALTIQYVRTTRTLDARMATLLLDETAGLARSYEAAGLPGLVETVEAQRQDGRVRDFFYLVAGPDGRIIAGDLAAWPEPVETAGRHRFQLLAVSASGGLHPIWVDGLSTVLDRRYRLLVARHAEDLVQVRRHYVAALILSLLATGTLGLLLGWWFSRRAVGFVEEVVETANRFLRGNLEDRVPVSGRGDGFDHLAATMNACFDEIEHVVRSLRAATDGLAHDLKTPLTRIRARLELTLMRNSGAEELREAVDKSRADLDILLRIIDDVLDVARAEAASPASFVELNLREIVGEALELYDPVAESRSIRLQSSLSDIWICGIRSLVGQLVVNLIDNAIKFAPEGSIVSVSVRSSDGAGELCVADKGPGIPEERREEALLRFSRLESGASGSGIGLSIVSAVARVHRARLTLADNAPGLRVTVAFPKVGASR